MLTHRFQLCFVVHVVVVLCASVNASDLGHSAKLKTSLIPRKASSARDRASEVVQRSPDFMLWDGPKKIVPSGAGHVFLVEKIEGDRLLLSDMNEGLRGWASVTTIVTLADGEAFFTAADRGKPREVRSPS